MLHCLMLMLEWSRVCLMFAPFSLIITQHFDDLYPFLFKQQNCFFIVVTSAKVLPCCLQIPTLYCLV